MLVDSHAHLNSPPLRDNLEPILKKAKQAKVKKIIVPLLSLDDLKWLEDNLYRDGLFFSLGIHPSYLTRKLDASKVKQRFVSLVAEYPRKIIAIGETGLDKTLNVDCQLQLRWFLIHVNLANRLGLPLIIHNRGCRLKFRELIANGQLKPPAVFHAFIGKPSWAEFLLKRGFYLGLGGLVTYPSFNRRNWLLFNDYLDRLLLETDSPYLIPQEIKAKESYNQPANVKIINRLVARELKLSQSELAIITTRNADNLFHLK